MMNILIKLKRIKMNILNIIAVIICIFGMHEAGYINHYGHSHHDQSVIKPLHHSHYYTGIKQPELNMQQPEPNMQRSESNMQQPESNMQRPESNMDQPEPNMQQLEPDMQRPESNMQQPEQNMDETENI